SRQGAQRMMARSNTVYLVFVAAIACGKPAAKPVKKKGPSQPVAAQLPGVTEKSDNRGYVAVVAPRQAGAVSARITATIERVFVQVGDSVKVGYPIVSLDAVHIRDELRAAQSSAAAARAASAAASFGVANARREFGVESRLASQGVSSEETVKTAKNALQK